MPTPRIYATQAERQRAYRERQSAQRLADLKEKKLPAESSLPNIPSLRRWRAQLGHACKVLAGLQAEMESYRDGQTLGRKVRRVRASKRRSRTSRRCSAG